MALKQATIKRIASLLKVDEKALADAIKSDKEEDVTISDDLEVLDKTTLDTRDKNKYKEGKKAGEEMVAKKLKKDHAIEAETDDPGEVVKLVTEKVKKEAAGSPDARVTELEGTIDTMKKKYKAINEENERLKEQAATLVVDTKLLSHFPANAFKALSREEMLQLVKQDIKVVTEDGKEVVYKKGTKQLADKTLDPVPVADVINGYFTERNWLEAATPAGPSGRGGGNSNPADVKNQKFTKYSDAQKHVTDQGVNLNGEKGNAMLQAIIKENPDMDMKA